MWHTYVAHVREKEHRFPWSNLVIAVPARNPWPCPPLAPPSDAFEKRQVSKRYVALVAGELEGSGSVTVPLDGKVSYYVCALSR